MSIELWPKPGGGFYLLAHPKTIERLVKLGICNPPKKAPEDPSETPYAQQDRIHGTRWPAAPIPTCTMSDGTVVPFAFKDSSL